MELVKGNYKQYTCVIKSGEDVLTNLDTALNIIVELKLDPTQETPNITKSIITGDVTIVDVAAGKIQWEFTSIDTADLIPGLYAIGVQIEYSDLKQYEIKLTDINLNSVSKMMIKQDIIN